MLILFNRYDENEQPLLDWSSAAYFSRSPRFISPGAYEYIFTPFGTKTLSKF